ncbi:chemotaxis protein CheW [Chamaesiphon sp. OTE_75_metabat_556]|uniref:chemotaxis protein CheW n=1 Tax=Chamaesiphon sp. OTE_75_metabat_556 TaxID=2964692 RepID=UPI00286A5D78|nr:chemotaxis protein CheW [Chamaesiphon sp. OTE_75_metabat_556]
MSANQNLLFGLHGSLYGISTTFVREICWLPELYSLATAPIDTIGIFNWRSRMVPVMHLDLRFGRSFSGCSVTDRVIVVEFQGTYLGIVAHEVYDVQLLAPVPLDLALIQSRQSQIDRNFIVGIAQSNDTPVACLDLDRLIREPDVVAALGEEPAIIAGADADFYSRCCPDATVADRATFATRALQLKESVTKAQSTTTETGVLVVQIGTEYIGLPLELTIDVDALDRFVLSPVPVAPPYLLGQLNWRGEILPLLELGGVLQIPTLPRQELVIIQVNDIKIGIAVDRIFDVFYLATDQIDALPLSVNDRLRGYLSGVTNYADGLMYLVKLQELVKREFLPTSV